MARINKRALTRLEIIQVASRKFLNDGCGTTAVSAIARELEMLAQGEWLKSYSPGYNTDGWRPMQFP